jgi:hypothetical protein
MALNKTTTDLDGSTVLTRGGLAVQTGTTAEHAAYTGELGEITYDTDKEMLVGHDGSTAGGFEAGGKIGAEATYAAGLATVASLGVAVKLVAVTTAKGDASLITVGTDNTFTTTYNGTRLLRVRGVFDIDVAAGADNLTLHVYVGGVSVFETAAQAVTAATLKLFEFDVLLEVAGGDAIEIYAENEDTTANITSAAAAERVDTASAHGFVQITGA